MLAVDGVTFPMLEARLRTRTSDNDMERKVGRILGPRDYDALMTGPVRLLRPDGGTLAVYLPGVLRGVLHDAWPVLSRIRQATDNRGAASGTPWETRGDQRRVRSRNVLSSIIGTVDRIGGSNSPGKGTPAAGKDTLCRLTAWTGRNLPAWQSLTPVFDTIDSLYAQHVPDRYRRQYEYATATHPDWRIGSTAFTTVTVNNTYSTGVHKDAGDLPEGFSTLAVTRRGDFIGGQLVLPQYRVAFDMRDGDLLLFDAHEWHGNTNMYCPHQDAPLARPCPQGCERVSLVAYYRTKVQHCGSAEDDAAKAMTIGDTTP